MIQTEILERFSQTAETAGAAVVTVDSAEAVAAYVAARVSGPVMLPAFASGERLKLKEALEKEGLFVITEPHRADVLNAAAGVTGVNFAIADTGSLVLDSTAEEIRLATTFPPQHFALLDPDKIVVDGLAAVPPMRELHRRDGRNFVAYITGPSRTADIERVLTIGVHGPKQLHILLVSGLSSDPLEM